jgi:hypothetical protein
MKPRDVPSASRKLRILPPGFVRIRLFGCRLIGERRTNSYAAAALKKKGRGFVDMTAGDSTSK